MSTAESNGDSIQVELLDGVPAPSIAIHQAWLPMTIWEKVRVRIKTSRGLTLMERFVIKCLLDLGTCGTDDLLAIATLPPEMAGWLLGSLEHQGLAQRKEDNVYMPVRDVCTDALKNNCIPTEHEEDRAFLWFPETEEFVVWQNTADIIQKLRKMNSMGNYPLPQQWKKENRGRILNDAFDAERVNGQGADAISSVSDEETIEDDTCPAYYCRAVFPDPSSKSWNLEITGHLKNRRSSNFKGTDTSRDDREFIKHTLNIPVLPRLVENWYRRLKKADKGISDHLAGRGLTKIKLQDHSYRAAIDKKTAKQMAQQNMLSESWNLAIRIDQEIEYRMPIELRPASPAAKALFSLDNSIRGLLAATNAAEVVDSICEQNGITQDNLLDRLWELKLFAKVYELREQEDFAV